MSAVKSLVEQKIMKTWMDGDVQMASYKTVSVGIEDVTENTAQIKKVGLF